MLVCLACQRSRCLLLALACAVLLPVTVAAGAQMPSMPSAPSVPGVPSTPTAPTVPTAPSAPSAPGGVPDVSAAKQDVDAVKAATKGKDKQPEPPKPGSVGAALIQDSDQVVLAETKAAGAGNTAGMEAARDLAIAISSVQNVYEDDLGREVAGKISPALKATLEQIQTALTQLNAMSKESLPVAATDAEQIRNSLPYHEKEPKLAKFTPRFLVPAKDTYLAKLHFTGSFDFAAKPEFFPSLVIKDHTYKPVSSSATDIEFAVPITDLFPSASPSTKLQYIAGTLKVPWETSTMMGKHHSKKTDSFRLLMAALPAGPGTVKFMSKSTRQEAGAAQRHTGAPLYQCSGRSCGKPDDINHVWTEAPDANCSAVPGSSSFDVGSSEGDVQHQFLGDGGEGVTYSVSTTRKGTGTSKVSFSIDFMETCGHEVANNIGDDVPLAWGESKTIKAPAGSWRVTLDAFDGQHAELTQANAANPLLKVTSTADAVTITAADPATLVWPQ